MAISRKFFVNIKNLKHMKRLYLFLGAVLAVVACQEAPVEQTDPADDIPAKTFTFTIKGDFSGELTKGYLMADGKEMTDLWILDYMDDRLIQQMHLNDTDEEWGEDPTLTLAFGPHHVYFVASRGQSPTLSTEDKTIIFTKVLDTFWKDYEVNVVPTSDGDRVVTLDRVVTRLKLTLTDAIADNTATIHTTPATWYYGINYTTGEPVESKSNTAIVVNVPANMIGSAGETVNIYGFSSATEWTTDVTVEAKNGESEVIGRASLEDVSLKRNRSTELSGPLFFTGGAVGFTLTTEWDESATGTW